MSSLREHILSCKPKLSAPYRVDAWDRDVYFRLISPSDLSRVMAVKDEAEADGLMTCLSCCDESGARVFKDEDLPTVHEMPWVTLHPIALAAAAHNGLTVGDQADAKN